MNDKNLTKISSLLIACFLCCAAAGTSRAQAPAGLDQISQNAQLVLVVPRLSGMSQKIAILNAALDLGEPELGDALGQFKLATGMNEGVRSDGAVLMVVENLAAAMAGAEPTVYLLMPVSDYAAFVGNFGADAGAAVAAVELSTGHSGFARKLGDYAVLSRDAQAVEGYQPGNDAAKWLNKFGKLGAGYVTASDVAVLIDIESLSPTLMGLAPTIQFMAEMGLAQAPPEQAVQARAAVQTFVAAFTAVVRDAAGLAIALDINDPGIGLTWAMQFKENSPLANMFQGGGDSTAYLSRLPNRPFFMAYAANTKALAVDKLIDSALLLLGATNPPLAEAVAAMVPAMKEMRGGAAAFYLPVDNAGPQPFSSVSYGHVPEAEKYKAAFQEYVQKMNDMPIVPGSDQHYTARYLPNQIKIGDISVDQYQLEMPAAAVQMSGPLAAFSHQNGYLAAKGEYVIAITPPDMPLLQDALAAVDQQTGLGAQDTIAQARQTLTPDPALEFYFNVSSLMQAFSATGPAAPNAAAKPAPPVPPVTMSASVQGGGIVARQYLPMPVAAALKQMAPVLGPMLPTGDQNPGGDEPF